MPRALVMSSRRFVNPVASGHGRMRAQQLAASDPARALAVARDIPDPWYRVQAFTSVARRAPEDIATKAFREARAAAAEAPDEYQRTASLAGIIGTAHARGERALAHRILQEALAQIPQVEPANSRAYALHQLWCVAFACDDQMRRQVIDCALAHCDPDRGWRAKRLFRDMAETLAWDRPDRARALIAAMRPSRAREHIAGRRARGERRQRPSP